ncbi:MAG TPA: hypothetical protein VEC36_03540 [Patescibacteria group bacterium]|nr:hypothetical protein [Patescibacteria group bacterium]
MNNKIQKSLDVLANLSETMPSPIAAIETVTTAISLDTPDNREKVSALAAVAAFGFAYNRMKNKESILTYLVAGGAALAGYYGADLLLDAVHRAKGNQGSSSTGEDSQLTEVDYE